MNKKLLLVPVLLAVSILLTGCAEVPKRELKCGAKIKGVEIICRDGMSGCSRKIRLEDDSTILISGSDWSYDDYKINGDGQLCLTTIINK